MSIFSAYCMAFDVSPIFHPNRPALFQLCAVDRVLNGIGIVHPHLGMALGQQADLVARLLRHASDPLQPCVIFRGHTCFVLNRIAQGSDAVDFDLNDVTRLEVLRRVQPRA